MLEVLKILAGKVNGKASVVLTTMTLIYMLGTAAAVSHFGWCVGIITFLCIFFLLIQAFTKKDKEEK